MSLTIHDIIMHKELETKVKLSSLLFQPTKRKPIYKPFVAVGFTLLELLIVIAIIAMLTGLLLPALKQAKDKTKQIQCTGNLKQIATMVSQYVGDSNDYFPHGGDAHRFLLLTKSWKQLIVQYSGKDETAYNCEHGVFNCPTQQNLCINTEYGYNGFFGGYGWNWAFLGWRNTIDSGVNAWVKVSSISKPAMTLCTGDSSDYFLNSSSYAYRVFSINKWDVGGEGVLTEANRHLGGGNYLWCDGHVAYYKNIEIWNSKNTWFGY